MKYCIRMKHVKNGNLFKFCGFKEKNGVRVPDNSFYSSRRDFRVFKSIREACRAVDQIDRSVWRPIIVPYPVGFFRWHNLEDRA